MTTTINAVGTIATDPRLIAPASGTPLCSFRIASDERRFDREQQSWVDGHTNWLGIVCFRSLASHAQASFKKGDRVIVTGRLRIRDWEKGEKRGTSVEIEADAIGHDLRWGVSKFEKKRGQNTDTEDSSAPTTELRSPQAEHEPSRLEPEAPVHPDGSRVLTTSGGEPSEDGFTPGLVAA